MLSVLGLAIYLMFEFLRPEVLFPDLSFSLMFWVAVGTLVLWFIEMLASGWRWQSFYPTRFFALFVVVCLFSSIVNWPGVDKVLTDFQDVAKLFCIYLVLLQSVNSEQRFKFIYCVMMALILFLALEGVGFSLGWAVRGFRWDAQNRLEYSGIFKDSNDLGQIWAVGWTLILFHFVNGEGVWKKIIDIPLLILFGWAMLLTASRGDTVAAIFGLFLCGRHRFGVWKPAALAILIFVVMHVAGIARMNLVAGESSSEDRVISWGQGWYMFRSHPLLGVGPNNFREHHPLSPHSTLVQVGAETGLLGLVCWVGLFYSSLRKTILTLITRRRDGFTSGDVGGADYRELQMQAAVFVCFVSSLFLTRAYMLPLYLLLGLVLAAGRMRRLTESADFEEANADMLLPIGWASMRQIAGALVACIFYWRFMARHFIDGI